MVDKKAAFLKKLKILPTQKLDDLEIDQQYKITKFEEYIGKYGKTIKVEIDNEFSVFIPGRFTKNITATKGNDVLGDQTMYLIYRGKEEYKKKNDKGEIEIKQMDVVDFA
jgi:hypothetical protein